MITQKIQAASIVALKAGQSSTVTTLRYILAQIKNKEIEKNSPTGGELTDEETVMVLKKIAKELNESITAFEKGNRSDLVAEYKKQLKVVMPYLPKELSDEELKTAVKTIVDKNVDLFQKNPKAIIGVAMKELRAQADSSRIMTVLKSFGV